MKGKYVKSDGLTFGVFMYGLLIAILMLADIVLIYLLPQFVGEISITILMLAITSPSWYVYILRRGREERQ